MTTWAEALPGSSWRGVIYCKPPSTGRIWLAEEGLGYARQKKRANEYTPGGLENGVEKANMEASLFQVLLLGKNGDNQ